MRELAEITGNPAAIDRVKDLEVRIQGLRTKANEVSRLSATRLETAFQIPSRAWPMARPTLGEAVRGLLSNLATGMGEWAAWQLALRQEGVMGLISGASKTAAGAGAGAAALWPALRPLA